MQLQDSYGYPPACNIENCYACSGINPNICEQCASGYVPETKCSKVNNHVEENERFLSSNCTAHCVDCILGSVCLNCSSAISYL